jgi:hypothetical protein
MHAGGKKSYRNQEDELKFIIGEFHSTDYGQKGFRQHPEINFDMQSIQVSGRGAMTASGRQIARSSQAKIL